MAKSDISYPPMPSFTSEKLKISEIQTESDIHGRVQLCDRTVHLFAELFSRGTKFPPIVIFYDGKQYWLSDGFHRYYAAKVRGHYKVACHIKSGTYSDAKLYAASANRCPGCMKRTNADKRKSVMIFLRHPQYSEWSDREIAEQCGVSSPLVGKIRKELLSGNNSSKPQRNSRIARRNGVYYTIDTSNIGRTSR